MHWAVWIHARIEFDLAESAFVACHVLLQESEQSFSLLRTEINTLKIPDIDLGLALLLQRAEDQEKVPDIDAHLHTVGIVLAVVRSVGQLDVRLRWEVHTLGSVTESCEEKGSHCACCAPGANDKNCHWIDGFRLARKWGSPADREHHPRVPVENKGFAVKQ